MKNISKTVLFIILLVTMLLACTSCKWDDAETRPTSVETHEETDEDGNTYTVTYEYVDSTNRTGMEPGFYKAVIVAGGVFLLMSAFFGYMLLGVKKFKDRCTVPVSATVVKIRASKRGNEYLRNRYLEYNGTYRYFYNNNSYESQNDYYGVRFFLGCELKEGDFTTIHIDPSDPYTLFDIFAKHFYNRLLYLTIFLLLASIASFASYIFL